MYVALLRAGVLAQEALEWLDNVRQNGYDARFTLEANREEAALAAVEV